MLKNDFVNEIYDEKYGIKIKGFVSSEVIKILRENSKKEIVLQGMEYRPDKLAAYYLGDERLGWLLTLANSFTNGIKDYYLGREILVPTNDALLKLNS